MLQLIKGIVLIMFLLVLIASEADEKFNIYNTGESSHAKSN